MLKHSDGYVMIQFPVTDIDGKLYVRSEFRGDDCLIFYPNGHISSNGGSVGHHEISEDIIDLLPQDDQKFVRDFLDDPQSVFQAARASA